MDLTDVTVANLYCRPINSRPAPNQDEIKLIQRIPDWTFNFYPCDTPAMDFGPFEPFVDLWRQKGARQDGLPTWRDFDILDFEGWWGQVSMGELHIDPVDLTFRLWGTKLTDWWGFDYTNKSLSQTTVTKEIWFEKELQYLTDFASAPKLGFITGSLIDHGRDYRLVHGIDLPLGRNGRVTHVLTGYQLRKHGEHFTPTGTPLQSSC